MKMLLASIALATLSGCGTIDLKTFGYDGMTLDGMASKIKVTRDDIEGLTRASSQDIRGGYDIGGAVEDIYVIATSNDSYRYSFAIFFNTKTNDPMIPVDGIIGMNGTRAVDVKKIDSDVECGLSTCFHKADMVATFDIGDVFDLIESADEIIPVRLIMHSGARLTAKIRKTEIIVTLNAIGIDAQGQTATP